jgi:hypothetical protein
MANRIIRSPLQFKELPPISASLYLLGHLLQHQEKQLIVSLKYLIRETNSLLLDRLSDRLFMEWKRDIRGLH